MKRRSGITLIEVLVAIFIMAIGLLALLTLFPLAALTMSKALQDDRAATCASDAANIFDAFDIRHDPFSTLPANWGVAYIDPNGTSNPAFVGASNSTNPPTPGIQRVTALTNMTAPAGTLLGTRYFTLLDDVTFATSGVPDTTSTNTIARGDRYSWAYMLHRLQPISASSPIDLVVVVYAGRPTQVASGENTYVAPVDPTQASNFTNRTLVTLDFTNLPQPNIRRGTWILDTGLYSSGQNNQQVSGDFYRVVSVNPAGPNTLNLELQTPLLKPISAVTVLDNVVEVFERGTTAANVPRTPQ